MVATTALATITIVAMTPAQIEFSKLPSFGSASAFA
jgi:hypothetical protein